MQKTRIYALARKAVERVLQYSKFAVRVLARVRGVGGQAQSAKWIPTRAVTKRRLPASGLSDLGVRSRNGGRARRVFDDFDAHIGST